MTRGSAFCSVLEDMVSRWADLTLRLVGFPVRRGTPGCTTSGHPGQRRGLSQGAGDSPRETSMRRRPTNDHRGRPPFGPPASPADMLGHPLSLLTSPRRSSLSAERLEGPAVPA